MRRPKLYLPWHAVNGDAEVPGATCWFLGDARGESVEVGSYMAEESVMHFVAEAVNNHDRLLAVERRWKAMAEYGWYLLKGETDWALFEGDNDSFVYATGPTPKAAVDAAIEKLEDKK